MSPWSLIAAVPQSLAVPVGLALIVPVVAGILWFVLRRRGARSLATTAAVGTGALATAALGAGIVMSALGVLAAGAEGTRLPAEELASSTAEGAARVLETSSGDTRELGPLLSVLRASRVEVAWTAIVRLNCTRECIVGAQGLPSDERDVLARLVAEWPDQSPSQVWRSAGFPVVTGRAAVRGTDGIPFAVAIAAFDIRDVATRATRNAWQLLLAELVLFLLAWGGVRRLLNVTVSERLRSLTDRLPQPATAATGAGDPFGSELSNLSQRVEASVLRNEALEARLQQAHRLEAIGRLSGGVAHDFNNLLTVIRANAQLLREDADNEELEAIDAATQRGAALVRKLLAFGRSDVVQRKPERVGPLLHEIMATVRRIMPTSINVRVSADIPDDVVLADRAAVEQIVLNLASNARDAMPDGGTFTLDVARSALPEAAQAMLGESGADEFVRFRFSDTGLGMSAHEVSHAFEPFFTSKSREQGSGLGLAMVHGLVRSHHGWVDLESQQDCGTTITIYLPRTGQDPAIATQYEEVVPGAGPALRGRVLVVEDEAGVRAITARSLERLGWSVDSADHGRAALDRIHANGSYDVVVSDVMMPVMGGLDLVKSLRGEGSQVPVLLVTGYSVEDLAAFSARYPRVSTLGKPWSAAQLDEAITALLHAPASYRSA